jgi:hypothetical protein
VRIPLVFATACALALIPSGLASSATRVPGFKTTSGAVSCVELPGQGGERATLVCTVREASYAHTLQARCIGPAGHGVDWHGFTLTAGRKGKVSCSGGSLVGGSQRPALVALRPGGRWHQAPFACWSRGAGVTCRDGAGHGLQVSRAAWRTW